jgi:hypothetical protein
MISAVIVPLASEQQPPAHEKSDKVNCCISTQTFTFLGALRLSKFFWWCVGVFWCESTLGGLHRVEKVTTSAMIFALLKK